MSMLRHSNRQTPNVGDSSQEALLHCPNDTLRTDFPLQVPSTSVTELTLMIALCMEKGAQLPAGVFTIAGLPGQQSYSISLCLEVDVCVLVRACTWVGLFTCKNLHGSKSCRVSALLLETAEIRRKTYFFSF